MFLFLFFSHYGVRSALRFVFLSFCFCLSSDSLSISFFSDYSQYLFGADVDFFSQYETMKGKCHSKSMMEVPQCLSVTSFRFNITYFFQLKKYIYIYINHDNSNWKIGFQYTTGTENVGLQYTRTLYLTQIKLWNRSSIILLHTKQRPWTT